MRALVCNLTRFGDLLQSQPLITNLHESGHSVGLLCLENFAKALPLLRHLEGGWALPAAKLMATLDRDWARALEYLAAFAGDIREHFKPDVVINLTASLSSRLLAKMLAPTPEAVLGFGVDADGFGINKGTWTAFLGGSVMQRQNAPFNIVDMFRMVPASLFADAILQKPATFALQQPGAKAREYADELLRDIRNLPGEGKIRGFVAMQPGASASARQWPVASFAALADILWESEGLCPVILGSQGEIPLGEAFAAEAHCPHVLAQGKTDIPQLAALLTKCRLLVTNDTGTMHLAAGLGIPSLAFFLATAQPWDTGPYLPGCLCLEPALPCHPCGFGKACPHDHRCLGQITAKGVAEAIGHWLHTGVWQSNDELNSRARVWQTCEDEAHFALVRCLSGHDAEDRSLWLLHQRIFWRHFLDSMDDRPVKGLSTAAASCSVAFCERIVPRLEQAGQLLHMLAEQGRIVAQSPMAGSLFLRNCDRLQTLFDSEAALRGLGFFWQALRMDLGGNIEQLIAFIEKFASELTKLQNGVRFGTHIA